MAVANTKSTIITNADATPVTLTSAQIAHARLREQAATVEVAAADDAASVYRLFRVHSSWRLSSLLIGNDAITGMTTADVGLYQTAENGGVVVGVALFASALDMSSARVLTEAAYEATAADISKIEQQIWQRAGLSADPNRFYDIAVTATTNEPTAAGTIAGLCRYSDNT